MILDTVRPWFRRDTWDWNRSTRRWRDVREESSVRSHGQHESGRRIIAEFLDRVTGWFYKMAWPGRLFIQGSVSHLVNGDDFTRPTDEQSVRRTVEYIRDTCSDLGICIDPSDARLSRVDVAGNSRFDLPAGLILGELGRLGHIGPMGQQVDPNRYGHPYARWANTQREQVFYLKGDGYLRSEYRLMHTAVCERHGLFGLDDLERTGRLASLWVDANTAVIEEAVRSGVYSERRDIEWGTAEKVASLLRTPNARVAETLQYFSRTGLEEFIAEIGGLNHLRSWTADLGIPPHRKKRFLDYLMDVLRTETPMSFDSVQVWSAFEQWIDRERRTISTMEIINEQAAF